MKTKQPVFLHSSEASQGLWLKERYNLLKTTPLPQNETDFIYVNKWRKVRNVLSDESFNLKLTYERYEKDILDYVLSPLQDHDLDKLASYVESKQWLKVFNEGLELLEEEKYQVFNNLDWGMALRPFANWCCKQLAEFFSSVDDKFEDKNTIIKNLIEHLAIELVQGLTRSAVLELHILKLEGKLKGDTSKERFEHFIDYQFSDPERLTAFYTEYIVLTRLLTTRTIYFVDNIKASIIHFLNDYKELERIMGLQGNKVLSINPGMGDTHQKGKTVIRFEFSGDKKLFYKPKNLSVASSYNNLIQWINNQKELLDMPTYNVIARDEYSWEEAILKEQCISTVQVQNFYERFGQLLGLMHCIRGGDFHFENLIAKGEYPYIIDLETLFQQPPLLDFPDYANVVAKNQFIESVMFTSLLPNRSYRDLTDEIGIDMSGLNGKEQKAPFKVLAPHDNLTDEMRYEYTEFTISNKDNLPMLQGEYVNYKLYKEYIYKGFKNTCYFFIKHQSELINNTELLPSFQDKPVRIILRATQRYANMLSESMHPDYMRDGLKRDQLLENMWSYMFKDKKIIKNEVEDMLEGDIPVFFNIPSSKNLIDSKGRIIEDYFEHTSYNLVLERIKNLDAKEIEKQLSWIKVSLGDYEFNHSHKTKDYNFSKQVRFNKEYLVSEAREIGELLLQKAVYADDKETITWADVVLGRSKLHNIDVLPTDFYDGLSGVALFYYHLYKTTRNHKYKVVYTKIFKTIKVMPDFGNISAHYGNVSILQALSRISEHNSDMEDLLNKQLDYLSNNVDNVLELDYLGGYAGIINTLLDTYDNYGGKKEEILDIVKQYGDQLVNKLQTIDSNHIIGGMSHGASGISLILFKLHSYIPNNIYREFALRLLEIDRLYFDNKDQAWKDGREDKKASSYKHQWCHGSTGIGLSRLLISKYHQDEFIDEEIKIATNNIIENGFKFEDSLCHGNMGDLEFFLTLSREQDNSKYDFYIHGILSQLFEEKNQNNNYQIRSVPGFQGIGLFTGLSGVGYELLRIADSTKVPSVLY